MLTKLYYFLTVAKTGNLTRAAEDLFISQPALTMSIKRLEKELGVALFTRKNNRLYLTQYGEKVLPYADKLYNDYVLLRSALNIQSEPVQRIKFGSGISNMAQIVEIYMDKVCDGSIVFQQYYDYYDLRNALLEHRIDFAFCAPPITGNEIASIDIFSEPICALMNQFHPLSNSTYLTIDDLMEFPLITFPKNSPMRVAIDQAFAHVNTQAKFFVEVDSIGIPNMLTSERSNLITLYPLSRARSEHVLNGLVYKLILEPAFKRTLDISWSDASPVNFLEEIVAAMKDFFANAPRFQKWGSFPLEKAI